MFCSDCGQKIEDNSKFCPYCGKVLVKDKKENADSIKVQTSDSGKSQVTDELLFTARRSAWANSKGIIVCIVLLVLTLFFALPCLTDAELKILSILLLCLCLIYVLLIILFALSGRAYKIEIYTNRIKIISGIINKKESQSVKTPIVGVKIEQSLNGQIWNYGNILIDQVGTGWDIDSRAIKKPKEFKAFLETLIDSDSINKMHMHLMN